MTILLPNSTKESKVIFTSLAHNNQQVQFFPYDFEFDDSFKPEWNTQEAFGRMDQMTIYKRTTREASISFNVVAETLEGNQPGSAKFNFSQLQKFIQFLYPVYENIEGTQIATLSSPPTELPKAQQSITSPATTSIQNYGAQVIKKSPLFKVSFMNLLNNNNYVIAITSFKHKFKFEAGNSSLSSNGKAIPGEFNLSISFRILHTNIPGTFLNYE